MASIENTQPEEIIDGINLLLKKFYDQLLVLNEKGIELTNTMDKYNLYFEEDGSILKEEMKKIVNSVVNDG